MHHLRNWIILSICFFSLTNTFTAIATTQNTAVVPIFSQDGTSWGTGTYIAPNVILTAAHVITGLKNQPIFTLDGQGKRYTVSKQNTVLNPKYSAHSDNYDIAVIKLPNTYNSHYYQLSNPTANTFLADWTSYPVQNAHHPQIRQTLAVKNQGLVTNGTNDYVGSAWTKVESKPGESGAALTNQQHVCGILVSLNEDNQQTNFCLLRGANWHFVQRQLK
ncbi:trypsin-like serine peptidase [Bombilactobacillus thymidiniphilus]|uniref:Trypsin-like serine protease n=1 Tax=Bombilactobacillus thymidiniphilus TaxID=2923363 RepID=A0ABY4PBC8_9LACO|nr:trypsin-like serine protease [Bombilactobacillus thymidiniphilus]UQS83073.1 trypsin-like serine protease [Bombilactobacillus thymidiniphilus]